MSVGAFAHLPPLSEAELARQIDAMLRRGLIPAIEHAARPSARDPYWAMWKLPLFGARTPHDVLAELAECQAADPGRYVRLLGYDPRLQRAAMDMLAYRPPDGSDGG